MMRGFRSLLLPALLLGATMASAPAHAALSCEDIMNLVNVKVPTSIVVQTMKDSGEVFTDADVQCLVNAGAPSEVVNQARAMVEAAPVEAKPAPSTTPSRPSMAQDQDTIGGRTSTSTRRPASTREPEDLPEQGEEPVGRVPEAIQSAVNLIDARKPLQGSLQLYELMESGRYPEQQLAIHFYLGQALSDLEMYTAAQYHYIAVMRSLIAESRYNSEYFAPALARLVSIARLSGDESELIRLLPKLPPENYPRGAQSQLYYLVGLRYFEEDQLAEARRYLGQVSPKSDLYLNARYLEGVIYNKQGKLKSAVRSFRDVYREPVEATADPAELERVEALKDLALMNIARIYYGIERYDEATRFYELVDRDSRHWPESLFENAWSSFMQNDLNLTLGLLLNLQSPFFSGDEFIPEATVLRALTFFNLCDYKEVEKVLLGFEDRYRPMQAEMREFVKGYSTQEGKQLADQAWNGYFGSSGKLRETKLPKALFTRVLQNQDLAAVVRRLDMIDRESALVEEQKPLWRDALGVQVKEILENERQRLERRAGLLFLGELARQANHLNDLLTQSEIIRFEVVDAQRVDYQYKMQNPESLKTYQSLAIDFATSVDRTYWPFNGEFWKDELGYYLYTEQTTCK